MTEPFIVYVKAGEVTQLRGGGAYLTPDGAQHFEKVQALLKRIHDENLAPEVQDELQEVLGL